MFTKLRVICSIAVMLVILPVACGAEPLAEYKEARNMYLFAAACRASYDDLIGHMAVEALRSSGWEVEKYFRASENAKMRFLLAAKIQPETDEPMYLIAVTGTETLSDVIADFSFDKVRFYGHTVKEIEDNAKKAGAIEQPLVHWGFFQYVKAAWDLEHHVKKSDGIRRLIEELIENPQRKIYLTGHSLGGAVATLGGAGLLNVGVTPAQIEVVTFGAPAVGNAAFRRNFEKNLNLTRIVMKGDPITRVLQDMVGGYVQFGKQVNWNTKKAIGEAHEMVLYLDVAMKNYYEKRWAAEAAGVLGFSQEKLPKGEEKSVYLLPLENTLPQQLQPEFSYMKEALADTYRDKLPAYYFAKQGTVNLEGARKMAAELKCQLIAVPKVYAYKVKNEQEVHTIIFEQAIYDTVSGNLLSLKTFSSTTRNMTPLEAFMHNAVNMGKEEQEWLSK